jgi:hypothetical protein
VTAAGIVLRADRPEAASRARALGWGLEVGEGWTPRWPRTLFLAPNVPIPWDLLDAGFGLLDSWDVAVPFTREHLLAADVGSGEEREATRAALRDLRVPLYEPEILFARDSAPARTFLLAWRAECCSGGAGIEERLAFLRAAARVKPLLYVLPRAWFWEAGERAKADAQAGRPL